MSAIATDQFQGIGGARLGDALVGIACGLILILAIFGWAVFP